MKFQICQLRKHPAGIQQYSQKADERKNSPVLLCRAVFIMEENAFLYYTGIGQFFYWEGIHYARETDEKRCGENSG